MRFEVKATRGREAVTALQIDAEDAQAAKDLTRAQGYSVLSVRSRPSFFAVGTERQVRFPLVLFSQELMALHGAGLSLVEAMQALGDKTNRTEHKTVIQNVVAALKAGHKLSQALSKQRHIFPPLYIAAVMASEKTGSINDVLARYIGYQAQVETLRRKIVHASIYPALLMMIGLLVVVFLLNYVVPKFSRVLDASQADLPWLSRVMLDWGRLVDGHFMLVMGATVMSVFVLIYAATLPSVRLWAYDKLSRIPAVGERVTLYHLARFYRTVGMLVRGGIPLVQAMEMGGELLRPADRPRLVAALAIVRNGGSASHALDSQSLVTPVATRLLTVGERSGRMADMMEQVAELYDSDLARWIEWVSRVFEPLLMALIGIIIGGIVILMYMPIFELAGSIQ